MTKHMGARLSLAALAAALAAAPVAAKVTTVVTGSSPEPQAYSTSVTFTDLDLRENSARKALLGRVMSAAWAVCIESEGSRRNAERAFAGSDGNCPNSTYRAARRQITAAFRHAERGEALSVTSLIINAPAKAR